MEQGTQTFGAIQNTELVRLKMDTREKSFHMTYGYGEDKTIDQRLEESKKIYEYLIQDLQEKK